MSAPERPAGRVAVGLELEVGEGLAASWDEPRLRRLVASLVERELAQGCYVVSVHLVSDEAIRALNQQHRGKSAHTDVLAFPLHDPGGMRFVLPPGQPIRLGDVVVSYPRVLAQAEEYGHSAERELGYLVAHGVLHLLGFDHQEEGERQRMRRREEEALALLGLTR